MSIWMFHVLGRFGTKTPAGGPNAVRLARYGAGWSLRPGWWFRRWRPPILHGARDASRAAGGCPARPCLPPPSSAAPGPASPPTLASGAATCSPAGAGRGPGASDPVVRGDARAPGGSAGGAAPLRPPPAARGRISPPETPAPPHPPARASENGFEFPERPPPLDLRDHDGRVLGPAE